MKTYLNVFLIVTVVAEVQMDNQICSSYSFAAPFFIEREIDWCNLKCGKKHTLCAYKMTKDECKGDNYLYSFEKEELLKLHNELRMKIATGMAPGLHPWEREHSRASDMNELQWSDELAGIAQAWANQCDKDEENDECRITKDDEAHVGQNVGISISENPNYDYIHKKNIVINQWFIHGNVVNHKMVQKFDAKGKVRKYGQMVMGATTHVGCGAALFKNKKDKRNRLKLVCNYKPGLTDGKPLYKFRGDASGCKIMSEKYPGLCGIEKSVKIPLEVSKEKPSASQTPNPSSEALHFRDVISGLDNILQLKPLIPEDITGPLGKFIDWIKTR